MSHGKNGQKFTPKSVSRMSAVAAPVYGIEESQYRKAVCHRLRIEFSHERNAVKRIAEIARSTPHAAKNWWNERCTPGALHLSRLRAAVPALDVDLRKLEGMDAENDPMFARELADLMRRYVAKQQQQ